MGELTQKFVESATGLDYRPPNFIERIVIAGPLEEMRSAANRPSFSSLPEDVQTFLGHVSEVEGDYERISLIHNLVQDRMRYATGNSSLMPSSDLLGLNQGDCTDHARLVGLLATYVGFDPQDVYRINGSFKYGGPDNNVEPHSVLLVEKEGRFYVSDLNQQEVAELDSEGVSIHPVTTVDADTEEPIASGVFAIRRVDSLINMNGDFIGTDKPAEAKTNNDLQPPPRAQSAPRIN